MSVMAGISINFDPSVTKNAIKGHTRDFKVAFGIHPG